MVTQRRKEENVSSEEDFSDNEKKVSSAEEDFSEAEEKASSEEDEEFSEDQEEFLSDDEEVAFEEGFFQENVVREFLRQWGQPQAYDTPLSLWVVNLSHEKRTQRKEIPLLIFKETTRCQCCVTMGAGWDNGKRITKYHFVIPKDELWHIQQLPENILMMTSHILHGVTHSNGRVAHLRCINGYLGGSKFLEGREVMIFWERICRNMFKANKLSLVDDSVKLDMELRLLYGVAHGTNWFGQWGFEATEMEYYDWCRSLACIRLEDMKPSLDVHVRAIVLEYQTVSGSTTLQQLLNFILEQLEAQKPFRTFFDDQSERSNSSSSNLNSDDQPSDGYQTDDHSDDDPNSDGDQTDDHSDDDPNSDGNPHPNFNPQLYVHLKTIYEGVFRDSSDPRMRQITKRILSVRKFQKLV